MIAFRVRRRASVFMLPLALLWAACDSPNDVDPSDFDAQQPAEDLDAVMSAVDVNSGAFQALAFARADLAAKGAAPFMANPAAAPVKWEREGLAAAAAAAGPIIHDSLYGTTWVYDAEAGTYVADEDATGAPADGVRFVYYAMNPITHRPATPLNALGYIDLRDVSTSTTARLGIRLVDTSGATPVTFADYIVSVMFSASTFDLTLSRTAVGYISNGTTELEFDLSHGFTLANEGPSTISIDYDFEVPDEGVAAAFVFDVVADEQSDSARIVMAVDNGPDNVVLDVVIEGDVIDGDIRYNGVVVVLISGSAADPTFTRQDGSALSAADSAALNEFAAGFERVLTFAERLFGDDGGGEL